MRLCSFSMSCSLPHPRCCRGRFPIRCGPSNPRKTSRNCPGPDRQTRRFAWSIGWPKETPAEEILRLSEAVHCNLVVLGTHGKTGLGRHLTGSVAEAVLRKAVCPVLVVKTPLRATPDTEAETIANPGDPVDVRPLGNSLASAHTRTLVRTERGGSCSPDRAGRPGNPPEQEQR